MYSNNIGFIRWVCVKSIVDDKAIIVRHFSNLYYDYDFQYDILPVEMFLFYFLFQ